MRSIRSAASRARSAPASSRPRRSVFSPPASPRACRGRRRCAAHAGRYAAYSLLATLTPAFAWAVGGTAVVEVVFAAPGISQFLVESIAVRDYFVLQAYIITMAVWMLALHLIVAMLQAALDPRVR